MASVPLIVPDRPSDHHRTRSADPRFYVGGVLGAIESWGATAAERAATYGCDALVRDPDRVLFRAVDVAAPAPLVFRWLCQIRVAPYSYDWIDNLGRRSPRTLTPGVDELKVGQRFNVFTLAAFEPDRSITLECDNLAFGHVGLTYAANPAGADRCRLVAKVVLERRWGAAGRAYSWLLAAGDLVMMRKQLLTFKELAERDSAEA